MKIFLNIILFLCSLMAEVNSEKVGSFSGEFSKVIVNSNYIYAIDNSGNFNIIDTSIKSEPFSTSNMQNLNATNIFSNENYSYISTNGGIIEIIEQIDKYNPKVVGEYYIEALKDIIVNDNYIYALDNYANLLIVDSSDKSSLIEVSRVNLYKPNSIYINENFIYVANDIKGVSIIDISDKSTPIIVATITSTRVLKIFVENNYLYLLDDSEGLKIFDISNLEDIKLISSTKIESSTNLIVEDNFIYIYSSSNKLYIYDITDKSTPNLINTLEFKDENFINFKNNFLYLKSINEISIYEIKTLKSVESSTIDSNTSQVETNTTTIQPTQTTSTIATTTPSNEVNYVTNIYITPTINITNESNATQNVDLSNMNISIDTTSLLEDELVFLKIEKGWNLISIPVDKNIYDMDKYGSSANHIDIKILNFAKSIWLYINGEWYENFDFIYSKQGFWLKSDEYKVLSFKGTSYSPELNSLNEEWQLLGTGEKLENIKDKYELKSVLKFTNGVWTQNPATIERGQGFWVRK